MKLGLNTGYWGSGPPPGAEEGIRIAEDLGFDSIWTAEAYGSDCLTPLAWWGAKTSRIKLGTSIAQISARTPAATAMAAMTLDHLSGGRVILGIGASGPQVVEGWYGRPYPRPLERTREYVQIMRKIFAREELIDFHGRHYDLPYTGKDGMGLGKALKSTIHPYRTDLPIYLAAEGPKNVALAGEIADGWLPLFFSPKSDKSYREALNEGFARPGARRTAADFEVASLVPAKLCKSQPHALVVDVGAYGPPDLRVDHRLRDGHAHEVAPLPEEVEVADKDACDLVEHVLAIREIRFELVDDMRGFGFEDGQEEPSFAVEVAVNKAFGAAGSLGDLAGRGGVVAALRENGVGGIDEVEAPAFAVAGSRLGADLNRDWRAPDCKMCVRAHLR